MCPANTPDPIVAATEPSQPASPRPPAWRRVLQGLAAISTIGVAVLVAWELGSAGAAPEPWTNLMINVAAVLAVIAGIELVVRKIIISTTKALRADLADVTKRLDAIHDELGERLDVERLQGSQAVLDEIAERRAGVVPMVSRVPSQRSL